jgi:hypothetical protein
LISNSILPGLGLLLLNAFNQTGNTASNTSTTATATAASGDTRPLWP